MKSSYTIPAAIVFAGIVIAVAVYTSSVQQSSPAQKAPENGALLRPVSASDHIFGNPAAAVTIVEYCDFDSPYCQNLQGVLEQIIANEGAGGQVAWVYREFPLTEIHPDALALARAAECAATVAGSDATANNTAFWKFADALFAKQPVDPSLLGTAASAAGIPGTAFATCYADNASTFDTRILADRQNALDMGAIGTPFSIIVTNGKKPVIMDGAYSYNAVKQLVDQALLNNPGR
jgi:protein-disulfide isomerase